MTSWFRWIWKKNEKEWKRYQKQKSSETVQICLQSCFVQGSGENLSARSGSLWVACCISMELRQEAKQFYASTSFHFSTDWNRFINVKTCQNHRIVNLKDFERLPTNVMTTLRILRNFFQAEVYLSSVWWILDSLHPLRNVLSQRPSGFKFVPAWCRVQMTAKWVTAWIALILKYVEIFWINPALSPFRIP